MKLLVVFICLVLERSSKLCNATEAIENLGSQFKYTELFGFNSLILNLANVASKSEVASDNCKDDFETISEGINLKKLWVMKLLDASAKPASGFISGNNFWLGSSEQCHYVSHKMDLPLSPRIKRSTDKNILSDVSPFKVQMRYVHINHSSPYQVQLKVMDESTLHLGLCLPKSCTNDEIHVLLQDLFSSAEIEDMLKLQPNVRRVTDLKLDKKFPLKKSLLLLVVVVVMIECLNRFAKKIIENEKSVNSNGNASRREDKVNISTFREIIQCFNLTPVVNKSESSVQSVSGLKTISCYYLMVGHMHTFSHFTLYNKVSFLDKIHTFIGLLISNAALLADGFFTISGYLAVSSFLRNTERLHEIENNSFMQNVKLYCKILLHRYVRLTPLYIMSILVAEIASSFQVDVSVYEIFFRDDLVCPKYWWRNLLYIHNLYPKEEICLNWSWSLGCDMQFFALVTAVLFFYAKHPRATEKFLKLSLVAFTLLSVFIHYINGYEMTYDVIVLLFSSVYLASWVRIGPYLLGTLCAISLHRNGGKLQMSKTQRLIGWLSCWIIFIFLMSSMYFQTSTVAAASVSKVLAHFTASLVYCWIIVADVSGFRNSFVKFLSKSVFVDNAKYTYAMYMLSPIVTQLIYGLTRTGASYRLPEILIVTYVVIVISKSVSVPFHAYFEYPFCNLSKFILQKKPSDLKAK